MALVDFYQLALLFKLSCSDVGDLSNPSYPPPMPTITPPNSHSRVDQPGQVDPALSPSTQLEPTTPVRNRGATLSGVHSTPLSVGTAMMQKLQPDVDQPQKYACAKYEQYIIEDFERNRVFIDIDDFMKHVLHIPEDWKTSWGRTIRLIKRTPEFTTAWWDLTRQSGTPGTAEAAFYKPLVDMTNAIVKLCDLPPDDSAEPRTRVRYLRNDPNKILHGLMKELVPDIVAVQDDFITRLSSNEQKEQKLATTNLTWAQPLHTLEVKSLNCTLVDGSCMPRLKMNGKPAHLLMTSLWLIGNRKGPATKPCPPSQAIATQESDICHCR